KQATLTCWPATPSIMLVSSFMTLTGRRREVQQSGKKHTHTQTHTQTETDTIHRQAKARCCLRDRLIRSGRWPTSNTTPRAEPSLLPSDQCCGSCPLLSDQCRCRIILIQVIHNAASSSQTAIEVSS